MTGLSLPVAIAITYLLGSIPTSQWVARARGLDLRRVGSNNLGATNLYRQLGWRFAIPTALFDMLKGVIPVAVLGPMAGLDYSGSLLLGTVAVVGHIWSVFAHFHGGKGVATGGGVILGLAPGAFLACVVIWALITRFSGYVSLASVFAALLLPASVWITYPSRRGAIIWITLLALLVVWMHRANIRRLLAGTESRFGKWRKATGDGR